MAAVAAARGPEAFTTVPQASVSPEASVTLSTRRPAESRAIAVTSLVRYSAPASRALRRHHSKSAAPSK